MLRDSTTGRLVKGFARPIQERFWPKVNKTDGCWEWTGALDANGYGRINIGLSSGGSLYAHRLSYEWHHGPIPPGWFVCHRCDNPRCVNPDHLFAGDNKANMQDCARKGRTRGPSIAQRLRGEKHPLVKLRAEQVIEIRSRYADGSITQRALADEFGISSSHISYIIRRRLWDSI